MPLPLAGKGAGPLSRNPTLIPNFDKSVVNATGGIDHVAPADYVTANPQVSATAKAVVSGAIVTADVVTFNLNQAQLSGGEITVNYTVAAGDSLQSIAEGVTALLEAALFTTAPEVEVISNEATITVNWPGSIGNFGTISGSSTGSEVFTLTPSGGVMTGGSGPVVAFANFSFVYNGCTMNFWYGQPYVLGQDLLKVMVAQGMPIG